MLKLLKPFIFLVCVGIALVKIYPFENGNAILVIPVVGKKETSYVVKAEKSIYLVLKNTDFETDSAIFLVERSLFGKCSLKGLYLTKTANLAAFYRILSRCTVEDLYYYDEDFRKRHIILDQPSIKAKNPIESSQFTLSPAIFYTGESIVIGSK